MNAGTNGVVNARRLELPTEGAFERGIGPQSAGGYLAITVDSHVSEPADVYMQGGLDRRFASRVPRMESDAEGRQFLVCEGFNRPQLVKGRPTHTEYEAQYERERLGSSGMMWSDRMEYDDLLRMKAAATHLADESGLTRIRADLHRDNVDAAVVFANRGMLSFATYDDAFAHTMSHAWNVWALDTYRTDDPQFVIAAQLAMADPHEAIKEVRWIAEQGFRAINIPCKPLHGDREDDIGYNHPQFDDTWRVLADAGIPLCMHVATGRDPRAATGSGGAVINKAVGFVQGTMVPLAQLLSSGVFERFPSLRFMTVEADMGWIPWLLESLDHAYYKHHMWVRPTMPQPPSAYWYSNCAASVIEDKAGLCLAHEYDLIDRVMWSNDYPHHEGTWPHSMAAMQRQLVRFTDEERARILGLNAAAWFGFDVERLLDLRATPPDIELGTSLAQAAI